MNEKNRLEPASGQTLVKSITDSVGESISQYSIDKMAFLRNAGFESGHFFGIAVVDKSVHNSGDVQELLQDLHLGLIDKLSISSTEIFSSRFGINSDQPITRLGQSSISALNGEREAKDVRLRFHDTRRIQRHSIPAKMLMSPYAVGSVRTGRLDMSKVKIRVWNSFIELIWSDSAGSVKITFVAPDYFQRILFDEFVSFARFVIEMDEALSHEDPKAKLEVIYRRDVIRTFSLYGEEAKQLDLTRYAQFYHYVFDINKSLVAGSTHSELSVSPHELEQAQDEINEHWYLREHPKQNGSINFILEKNLSNPAQFELTQSLPMAFDVVSSRRIELGNMAVLALYNFQGKLVLKDESEEGYSLVLEFDNINILEENLVYLDEYPTAEQLFHSSRPHMTRKFLFLQSVESDGESN